MEEIKEEIKQPEIMIQYVVIQLADGKRGIFVGPMILTETEMKLNPPRIVHVEFSKPKSRDEAPKGIISGNSQESK